MPIDERADATRDLPDGVLFDFSGTLFHVESAEQALQAALGPRSGHRAADLVRLGAINGSGPPAGLPDHLVDVWAKRDLSAAAHRAAYSGSAMQAGLDAEDAAALYERGLSPDAWRPFPDTVRVLRLLRELGVPVAMVSNIGWDPRPVLRHHDVDPEDLVLVLSDEVGLLKPDPEIFRLACRAIEADPRRCVMVGDNPDADAGAEIVGMRFVLVDPVLDSRAPDALLRAVGLVS